jgi:hypothetical protein
VISDSGVNLFSDAIMLLNLASYSKSNVGMKRLIVLFIILFLIDIAMGFSMSYYVDKVGPPNFLIYSIDDLISFPLSLWNRLFPEYGLYRNSTSLFWTILIVNALAQAFIVYGLLRLIKALRKRKG